MNKYLADHILQYGEALLPYLTILAEYSKKGIFGKPTTVSPLISSRDLQSLKDMGLIVIRGDDVYFTEGDRWLYEPRTLPSREKPSREAYCPQELTSLAEELGAPADFFKNTGKYVKLLRTTRLLCSDSDFLKAKDYFLRNKEDDWNLNLFLTKKAFLNFLRLSKVEKTASDLDRLESDYSDVKFEWK